MYISTFEFKKVRLLRNMDLVHKTVMLMFDGNRAEENVLYMIMDSKKNGAENAPVHMIVQSNSQPKNIPSDSLKLLNSRECSHMMDAIKNGVSRVHIMDGRIAHCLLLEIFAMKGIGTAILKAGDDHFYTPDEK